MRLRNAPFVDASSMVRACWPDPWLQRCQQMSTNTLTNRGRHPAVCVFTSGDRDHIQYSNETESQTAAADASIPVARCIDSQRKYSPYRRR